MAMSLFTNLKGSSILEAKSSASVARKGKYVVCSSEESDVDGIWSSHPSRSRSAVDGTNSYEHFHYHDVTVGLTWSGPKSHPMCPCSNEHEPNGTAHSQIHRDPSLRRWFKHTSTSGRHPVELKQCPHPCPIRTITHEQSWSRLAQRRSVWGLVFVTAGRGVGGEEIPELWFLGSIVKLASVRSVVACWFSFLCLVCILIFSFSPYHPRISTG